MKMDLKRELFLTSLSDIISSFTAITSADRSGPYSLQFMLTIALKNLAGLIMNLGFFNILAANEQQGQRQCFVFGRITLIEQ